MPIIREATEADRAEVVATVTLAFSVDFLFRWMLPGSNTFYTYFPQFADAFIGASIEAGGCYVSEGLESAAIWIPPGSAPDERKVGTIFQEAIPAYRQEDVGKVFDFMARNHPHDEDCWYLPLIGVDVMHQGKGLGSALMRYAVDVIDNQGALGYLDSSNPRNVPLYERFGFKVKEKGQYGESPEITAMLRQRQ